MRCILGLRQRIERRFDGLNVVHAGQCNDMQRWMIRHKSIQAGAGRIGEGVTNQYPRFEILIILKKQTGQRQGFEIGEPPFQAVGIV